MNHEPSKAMVISSLFWKLLERGGTQCIQLLLMIILARLLEPEDFGLLVLVVTLIAIANILTQSGFTTALIQKKKTDEADYSSVFFVNLLVATILYILLFFAAPIIATFFEQPQLIAVLRILALTLFLTALNTIQLAIISKTLQFKKLFYCSLFGMVISGFIGIVLAYTHFGVWALVTQQLLNQFLMTIMLFMTLKWRPQLLFSKNRIAGLFSFSWKLLVSSLIDTLDNNIRTIIIGKMFSPAILGFYNRGEQFPSLIISNISGSIQSVLLPTLAAQQDNRARVKEMIRKTIVMSTFIIFPMMVGLAVIAEPLVLVLFTEKWLEAVPFLQIFCAAYALWPLHIAHLQVLNALGRSDIYLKLEIMKVTLSFIILVISIPYGVQMMAVGVVVSGILSALINAYPSRTLIQYRAEEQLRDLLPQFLLALLMGGIIYPISWIGLPDTLTISSQVLLGIIIYLSFAKLFRLACLNYLLATVKEMIESKKSKPYPINEEV